MALLGSSLLWGTSFINIKLCGQALQSGAAEGTGAAFGPMLLTALRFTVAVPLLLVCWPETRRSFAGLRERALLLRIAVCMAAGFLIQAAGLAYTTATISAFITSVGVCLVPFLEWSFHRRKPSWRLALAVLLATGAVGMMTLGKAPAGPRAWAFGAGEVLTLICVVAFSFQVLWTGEATERMGAAQLTVGTFAFTGLASWLCVLAVWPREVPGALAAAAASWTFWALFAVIVLGATIGAMVLMNVFQRHVRPTEAAVIYTTEPVFAGVFAWTLRPKEEALGPAGFIGAGLMLVADLLAAVRGSPEPAGDEANRKDTRRPGE
ncbi:MAG TPA: DMT family transporter [Planctomycetota bacterium]|nr:DMT family transporter [Planctomycetota bacterium]